MEERAKALRADCAPGPGVLVLFPPVARNLMCRAVMPRDLHFSATSWNEETELAIKIKLRLFHLQLHATTFLLESKTFPIPGNAQIYLLEQTTERIVDDKQLIKR